MTTQLLVTGHRNVGHVAGISSHVGPEYSLEFDLYAGLQRQALQSIAMRDADDWPVLACAMMPGCPVWTEDADFFEPAWPRGSGTRWRCVWWGDASALPGGHPQGGLTLPLNVTTRSPVLATLGYPPMSRMELPCGINPFPGEASQ